VLPADAFEGAKLLATKMALWADVREITGAGSGRITEDLVAASGARQGRGGGRPRRASSTRPSRG